MEKEASVGKEYWTVPQIGRDKNVISGRLRERRLGPPETVLCEGTI